MRRSNLFHVVNLGAIAQASPMAEASDTITSLPLPSKTIFQFPNSTYWVENIAVRPNGNLLVTLLSPSAELWQIANPYSDEPLASLVYSFSEASGLMGITETATDTFVIAAQDLSTGVGGPAAAWEVAFGEHNASITRKIADIPDAKIMNGVTAVPGCGDADPSAVLLADSMGGLAFHLDLKTGNVTTGVQVAEMAYLATASSPVGINGIKIRDGYLYFDNSYAATVYRIKITSAGFTATGATVETVARIPGETFLDDFTFDPRDSSCWMASNHGSTVHKLNIDTGDSIVVAGAAGQQTVLGDTATAFGRTDIDRNILYVTTSGRNIKEAQEAGKIVAVDTNGIST